MAGGWATALGAAITGAGQGYQQGLLTQRQQQQQQFENSLATNREARSQQDAKDSHQQALLAAILGQDKVNELPKQHLGDDLDRIAKNDPYGKWNNPTWVNGQNQLAPGSVPTINIEQAKNADLAAHGFDRPVMSKAQLGQYFGVAPDTGAKIPLADQVGQAHLQQEGQVDQMRLDAMKQFSQGNGGGYETDSVTGLPSNSPANRMKELADPLKRITAMYGPALDMPQNAAAKERAVIAAKAEIPPAMQTRLLGGMQAMTDNLSVAQRELEKLYPGIETAVDDKGQPVDNAAFHSYNGSGPMEVGAALAKAKWNRGLYGFEYTPYNKAIQAASLGNVQGWSNLANGRISPYIADQFKIHQSAFGNETPLATYQRNKDLIDMTQRSKTDLFAAGQPHAQQAQASSEPAGPPTPPVGQVTPGDVAGGPRNGPPPQQQPATASSGAFLSLKGKTLPFSIAKAAADHAGMPFQAFANMVYGEGGKIYMDQKQ